MSSETQFLRIAKITGAHGLKGRLKILVISDIPERFNPGEKLFIKIGAEYNEYTIVEFIEQGGRASLLKLGEIEDRNESESLKGAEIFIKKEAAEKTRKTLDENVYYYYDLIGLRVFWNDAPFAEVNDIIKTGESCILVLKNSEGDEYMIPFVESMVDTKNINSNRIDINPVEGLFDIK